MNPTWHKPSLPASASPQKFPLLYLNNSLTRQKEQFIPRSLGPAVTWYNCGPTVYDASHMGHARTYITFDILRRVMEDYFSFRIQYVMNITDIDDKIIVRARQAHLLQEFHSASSSLAEISRVFVGGVKLLRDNLAKGAVALLQVDTLEDIKKLKVTVDAADPSKFEGCGDKLVLYLSQLQKCSDASGILEKATTLSDSDRQAFFALADDVIAPFLDAEKGSGIVDHEIFSRLTSHFEREYFEDMAALNIRPPTLLTRVTQYVPEIVAFVERIIENKFAYEANGSVYFDVEAFKKSGHDYAKLAPWAAGNSTLLAEGEGSLAAKGQGKRNANDFALWKASKPGEPFWESPWGQGRPGWHIECSAMAGAVLGDKMDIHSGGVDLCFPHHDNELAQSEAFFQCDQVCLEVYPRKVLTNVETVGELLFAQWPSSH
eukprot:Partr_v1_DN28990_c1_g1_i4_m25637 putative Cysteinyl-tRNA synthetase